MVTALPLYHIFALMVNFITYFSIGAENWLVANPRDMDGFVEILQQARCTVFTGVNTLYGGLLDASEDRRSGLLAGCAWRSAAAPRCCRRPRRSGRR